MRKGYTLAIGFILSLLGACVDGGTIDPNTFAEGLSSSIEESDVNEPHSSSSITKDKVSSSARSVPMSSVSVSLSSSDSGSKNDVDPDVFNNKMAYQYFAFSGKEKEGNLIIVNPKDESNFAVNTTIYETEKGAVSYCADEGKSYTLKVRLISDRDVKKLMLLKNLGDNCERVFMDFKKSCESKNGAEVLLLESCNSNGNMDALCSYTDESVEFESLIADFMNEVDSNCNSDYLNASLYLQGQW